MAERWRKRMIPGQGGSFGTMRIVFLVGLRPPAQQTALPQARTLATFAVSSSTPTAPNTASFEMT